MRIAEQTSFPWSRTSANDKQTARHDLWTSRWRICYIRRCICCFCRLLRLLIRIFSSKYVILSSHRSNVSGRKSQSELTVTRWHERPPRSVPRRPAPSFAVFSPARFASRLLWTSVFESQCPRKDARPSRCVPLPGSPPAAAGMESRRRPELSLQWRYRHLARF